MPFSSTHCLLVQSTTTLHLRRLLPRLKADLRLAGAWVSDARDLSQHAADLYLELPVSAAQPLYTALIRRGLKLSRSGHIALATLCSFERPFMPGRTLDLKLEIRVITSASQRFPAVSTISA